MVNRDKNFNEAATLVMPSVLSKPAALRGTHTSSEIGPEHLVLILMKMLLLAILSKFQSSSKTTQNSLDQMIKTATSDLKCDFRFFLQNCKNRVLLDSLARFVGKPIISFENVLEALTQVLVANPQVFGIQINSIIIYQTLQNALSQLFQSNKSFEMLFWNKVWKSHFETELQYSSHKQTFQLVSSKPLKVTFSDVVDVKTFSALEENSLENGEAPNNDVTMLVSAIFSAEQSVANLNAVVSSAIAFGEGNQSLTTDINDTPPDAAELVNASALGATSNALTAFKVAFEALEVELAVSAAAKAGETLSLEYAPSSEPSLGSLVESLKSLEFTTPSASTFDIPVETGVNSSKASAIEQSFADVIPEGDDPVEFFTVLVSNPLLFGERRAQSPQQCVEDRALGAHPPEIPDLFAMLEIPPPLPYKLTPSSWGANIDGGSALSNVGVGGNPHADLPSFPPKGEIEDTPVQELASSENPKGNPPGNSGCADHPKSPSSSKLGSDSSQVGTDLSASLPSTLGSPGSKVGKPVRPLPPTPVNPSLRGKDIGDSPPMMYSSGNQPESTSTTPRGLSHACSPLGGNIGGIELLHSSPPSSSKLGSDAFQSAPHRDPRTKPLPPMLNWNFSQSKCSVSSSSAAFHSRPLGQDIGGKKRTQQMLPDVRWLLLKAASLSLKEHSIHNPAAASSPFWAPMNLGTRAVEVA